MSDAFHGAHLRRDLVAQFGEHAVRVALRDGILDQPWRGVVVTRDRSAELETRAAAALLVLGGQGVLSGQTAAALHGCTGASSCGDIHVTVPYECRVRDRPGLVVHRDRLAADDVTTRLGLPILELDLVIADLLCTQPRRVALACADEALASLPPNQRATFRAEIDDRLAHRDDRRGTRRAEVLLALATGLAESPPESWMRLLVADAGLPCQNRSSRFVILMGDWSTGLTWRGRSSASRSSTTVTTRTRAGRLRMPNEMLGLPGGDGSWSERRPTT